MADRRWRHLLPLLGLGLLIASALLLRRQLLEVDFVLVWASIRDLPLAQLGLAIGFALAGYLAILGFDILALRYLDVRVLALNSLWRQRQHEDPVMMRINPTHGSGRRCYYAPARSGVGIER